MKRMAEKIEKKRKNMHQLGDYKQRLMCKPGALKHTQIIKASEKDVMNSLSCGSLGTNHISLINLPW